MGCQGEDFRELREECRLCVTELTPGEKARFQEAVAPMYEKYCSDYVDIINAIMEAGKAMSAH